MDWQFCCHLFIVHPSGDKSCIADQHRSISNGRLPTPTVQNTVGVGLGGSSSGEIRW